MNITMYLNLI